MMCCSTDPPPPATDTGTTALPRAAAAAGRLGVEATDGLGVEVGVGKRSSSREIRDSWAAACVSTLWLSLLLRSMVAAAPGVTVPLVL